MTTPVLVQFRGQEVKLAELCTRYGIDRQTVQYRLHRGFDLQTALTKPPRRYPQGVRRSRLPRPPAPAQAAADPPAPRCDRCGSDDHVKGMSMLGRDLCRPCLEDACRVLLSWFRAG